MPTSSGAPAVGDGGCGGEPPRLESVPPYVDWLAQLRVGFGKGPRSRYRVAGTPKRDSVGEVDEAAVPPVRYWIGW